MADQPPSRGTRAFKPRAGVQRRTKAERDAFAAEEADREAKRAKEAATASPRAAKASKRPLARKEDGSAAQNNSKPASSGDAGGVFGSATAERPGTRRILDAGSEEIVLGSDTATRLPASSGAGVGAGAQRQRPDSAFVAEGAGEGSAPLKVLDDAFEVDDEPEEARRDIDTIGMSDSYEEEEDEDDEEEEDDVVGSSGKGKGKAKQIDKAAQRGIGLRPLRAPIAVMPERYKADRKPKSALRAPKQPATEPTELDDKDTDELELIKEQPSSPELKRKTIKKLAGKTREVKFTHETPEERTERLRVANDIDLLRHAFAPLTTDGTSKHDPNDGKLFLLQFPPLTPMLTVRKPDDKDDDNNEKDGSGKDDDDDDDDMVIVQVKREDIVAKPSTAAADNKSKGSTIKKDPDTAPKQHATTSQDPHDPKKVLTACRPLDELPSGLVGKLNVHASGKITLDWAGTDMEVRLGTGVNFLQDAVLLHTTRTDDAHESTAVSSSEATPMVDPDPDPNPGSDHPDSDPDRAHKHNNGDAQQGSKAFALGQLDARMVVVPDWSKLYD